MQQFSLRLDLAFLIFNVLGKRVATAQKLSYLALTTF